MISHLLYHGNASFLPYISCPKQLTISGFNFLFDEQQVLSQWTFILNRLRVSDDITSLLMINSNRNQVQDILSDSDLLIKSRFILDSFDSITMELSDGTNFFELVPLCDQAIPNTYTLALPTYAYLEVSPTNIQYKNSKLFVLPTFEFLSDNKDI